jgi:tetratricopeptide (TPR) repeat protein
MLARKQYHEAEQVFRRLTHEQPKNAVYWNELGISLQNQTELSAALKCYEKSVKLDSRYSDAQNNIGTIWYERKKYPKAIRAYKKAIGIKDDFAAFYLNLGFAYFAEKEYDDSIAAFRKALQIDPASFDNNRARMGTVVQDRSLSTDRGKFYFLLAKSFAEAGNVERCVLYLKKARDEGYKDYAAAKTDPSFAAVLKDPAFEEVLASKPPETAQP